jgi:hypothetical protein
VDRAALDVAHRLGLLYGGWCPGGGWAEDRPEPPGVLADYPGLRPTPRRDPGQRTLWNVRDSDATLILLPGGRHISPGTRRTIECARRLGRPCRLACLDERQAAQTAARWLHRVRPATLNVAGPRESEYPGVYDRARGFLVVVLAAWANVQRKPTFRTSARGCERSRPPRRLPMFGGLVGDRVGRA